MPDEIWLVQISLTLLLQLISLFAASAASTPSATAIENYVAITASNA